MYLKGVHSYKVHRGAGGLVGSVGGEEQTGEVHNTYLQVLEGVVI